MKLRLFCFLTTLAWTCFTDSQDLKNPSFEEVISLQTLRNAQISPNGRHIVFQKQSTDWENNRFDNELWLSKDGDIPFQLTNTTTLSSYNPKWSPDSQWIGFLANRDKNTQIYVINVDGGEAVQVTSTKGNISNFEWSPDGKTLAFIQNEDKTKTKEAIEDLYGAFAVDEEEYTLNQLWTIVLILHN